MLTIDGSEGEGGGQILRTALALSAITGTPFRITNVRAGRQRPGLLRQHLTAVQAAAEISDAEVSGDELGSREITFSPRGMRPGAYTFAVGTAGSATLVLQTILWPLALASEPSRVKIDGGTHNQAAPPFAFLESSFAPIVRRFGVGFDLELARWGFYPAGGGRIIAAIEPVERLSPVHLLERGSVRDVRVRAAIAALPDTIARRELNTACIALGRDRGDGRIVRVEGSHGPGNVLWIEVEADLTAVFTGFGEKGVPAEVVASRAADEAKAWMDADVPVDEHLADQLLIPMALAGEGSFRTTDASLHTLTNAEVIQRFLDVVIDVRSEPGGARVTVNP